MSATWSERNMCKYVLGRARSAATVLVFSLMRRGLEPFSGVMLTVLVFGSKSVHFRLKISPARAYVSFTVIMNAASFGPSPPIN